MNLPRKYLNVFEMDRMRKSLLQKGRCGKYEEDREQENESKREEKAIFYNFQEDTVIESVANDHCVCTGGDRGLQSFGSRHRGTD